MRVRKNTVLLMSKLPRAGHVKTRLTTQAGGALSPEAACALYHCMLFDVAEVVMAALDELEAEQAAGPCGEVRDTYDLVISTAPAADAPLMRRLFDNAGTFSRGFEVIADEGADFGGQCDHAFRQCFERGADCVFSVRGDLPSLTKDDVKLGIGQLHRLDAMPRGGIVFAPSQMTSFSTVGWTRETDFSLEGLFGNRDVLVLPSLIQKAAALGLPALWLPPVPDVDTMGDLRHAITLVQALNYCAEFDDIRPPWRTAAALYKMGFSDIIVKPSGTSGS